MQQDNIVMSGAVTTFALAASSAAMTLLAPVPAYASGCGSECTQEFIDCVVDQCQGEATCEEKLQCAESAAAGVCSPEEVCWWCS
jgi:hypothetical protein